MLNLFTQKNLRKFFLCLEQREKKDLNPFKYIEQYCNVKMALIIEGIFISKTVTSLQIKVHECYIKPLKPRESLLSIEEENEVSESESESESEGDYTKDGLEELIVKVDNEE